MIHYTIVAASVAHAPALNALISLALQDSFGLTGPLAPNSGDPTFTHLWAGWNTTPEQITALANLATFEPESWPIGDGITAQDVADALAAQDFVVHTTSAGEEEYEGKLAADCRAAVRAILGLVEWSPE